MRGLVWLRVGDDFAPDSATLRVELCLSFGSAEALHHLELNASARELGAKQAQRSLKAWMKRQSLTGADEVQAEPER